MIRTIKKTNNIWWIRAAHLTLWVAISTGFYYFFHHVLFQNEKVAWMALLIHILGFIILVYLHQFYLVPSFFKKERYKRYFTLTILLILMSSFIQYLTIYFAAFQLPPSQVFQIDLYVPIAVISLNCFVMLSVTPLVLIENWFRKRDISMQFNTYQLKAELRLLRAQVNPHFLFNTLNNIYALSFVRSDNTSNMILKLSDMMAYMIYDCKDDSVPLKLEIDYLKNYIDLQQVKKDYEYDIDFNVIGDPGKIEVAPMLFAPFFEYAFRHGDYKKRSSGWIRSELSIKEDNLSFYIHNSVDEEYERVWFEDSELVNMRDRLNLLYGGDHNLIIDKKENTLQVDLSITLNNSMDIISN